MSTKAWAERRWWWLPSLVIVAANLVALVWYLLVYSDYAKSTDQRLAQQRQRLVRLESTLERRQQTVASLRGNDAALNEFYGTLLAPQSERLTDMIREVRSLARTSGLQPSTINYPEDDLASYGLVKRSFAFNVRGSYPQLRRFINLLELTDSFLTLEEVQLAGRGDREELRISMRLSTLFVDDDEQPGEAAS